MTADLGTHELASVIFTRSRGTSRLKHCGYGASDALFAASMTVARAVQTVERAPEEKASEAARPRPHSRAS